jgi:hypothetical protein
MCGILFSSCLNDKDSRFNPSNESSVSAGMTTAKSPRFESLRSLVSKRGPNTNSLVQFMANPFLFPILTSDKTSMDNNKHSEDIKSLDKTNSLNNDAAYYVSELDTALPSTNEPKICSCSLFASVLHLRGNSVQKQPFVYDHHAHSDAAKSESYFCFNGEVFEQNNSTNSKHNHDFPFNLNLNLSQEYVDELAGAILSHNAASLSKLNRPVVNLYQSTSDSMQIFKILTDTDKYYSSSEFTEHLLNTLSNIKGPWAIIFYHAPSHTLYFGRDALGRRSLLYHFPSSPKTDSEFLLTSVGSMEEAGFWNEVPTEGIYALPLKYVTCLSDYKNELVLYPWTTSIPSNTEPLLDVNVSTQVQL